MGEQVATGRRRELLDNFRKSGMGWMAGIFDGGPQPEAPITSRMIIAHEAKVTDEAAQVFGQPVSRPEVPQSTLEMETVAAQAAVRDLIGELLIDNPTLVFQIEQVTQKRQSQPAQEGEA